MLPTSFPRPSGVLVGFLQEAALLFLLLQEAVLHSRLPLLLPDGPRQCGRRRGRLSTHGPRAPWGVLARRTRPCPRWLPPPTGHSSPPPFKLPCNVPGRGTTDFVKSGWQFYLYSCDCHGKQICRVLGIFCSLTSLILLLLFCTCAATQQVIINFLASTNCSYHLFCIVNSCHVFCYEFFQTMANMYCRPLIRDL